MGHPRTAFLPLAAGVAAAIACGGESQELFPDQANWHVKLARSDDHPNYGCEGTVDTAARLAQIACAAEKFGSWSVAGPVQQFRSSTQLRLWIHAAATASAAQPDIAIDLESVDDRILGWATVVLPDGTGSGHPGATAEAWLEPLGTGVEEAIADAAR